MRKGVFIALAILAPFMADSAALAADRPDCPFLLVPFNANGSKIGVNACYVYQIKPSVAAPASKTTISFINSVDVTVDSDFDSVIYVLNTQMVGPPTPQNITPPPVNPIPNPAH